MGNKKWLQDVSPLIHFLCDAKIKLEVIHADY